MEQKRILITGGTGFLGRPLVDRLRQEGHVVSLFTRQDKFETQASFSHQVTAYTRFSDIPEEIRFDVVINLAGENILATAWDLKRRKELWDSRVMFTEELVFYCKKHKPSLFLQASACGYYGEQIEGPWKEESEESGPGEGFLATLCAAWEGAAVKLREAGVPVAIMRFSPIFAADGGPWPMLKKIYDARLGNTIGDGRQPYPWIHRDDVIGAILFLLEKGDKVSPIYNFNVPELINQLQSAQIIHRYLGGFRPIWYVPEKIANLLLGERAQLAIGGQFSKPRRLLVEGYTFQYPTLVSALPNLYPKREKA